MVQVVSAVLQAWITSRDSEERAAQGGRMEIENMKYHLAILTPGWIDLIFDGSKTIESRFTKVRCAPFGKVHEGDIVYLKESSGLVKGMFTVAHVETFENLTEGQICDLFYKESREQIFSADVAASMYDPPDKWLTAKHATLIHVSDPIKFDEPFPFPKRDPRAWVVLDTPLHDGNRPPIKE